MNFTTYQREAMKYADYPTEAEIRYLHLALVGECGEACNVLKKQIRNRKQYRERLVDETGDILWYLTALFESQGLQIEQAYRTPEQGRVNTVESCALRMTHTATELALEARWTERLPAVFWYLSSIWNQIGVTPEEVMEQNLDKLAARKAVGEIRHE